MYPPAAIRNKDSEIGGGVSSPVTARVSRRRNVSVKRVRLGDLLVDELALIWTGKACL